MLRRAASPSIGTYSDRSVAPSPAAVIEARRAIERAALNPLAYAMGEPLPGRSALDKLRRNPPRVAVDKDEDE